MNKDGKLSVSRNTTHGIKYKIALKVNFALTEILAKFIRGSNFMNVANVTHRLAATIKNKAGTIACSYVGSFVRSITTNKLRAKPMK